MHLVADADDGASHVVTSLGHGLHNFAARVQLLPLFHAQHASKFLAHRGRRHLCLSVEHLRITQVGLFLGQELLSVGALNQIDSLGVLLFLGQVNVLDLLDAVAERPDEVRCTDVDELDVGALTLGRKIGRDLFLSVVCGASRFLGLQVEVGAALEMPVFLARIFA